MNNFSFSRVCELISNLIWKFLLHIRFRLTCVQTFIYLNCALLMLFSILFDFFFCFIFCFLQNRAKRFDLFDLHCVDNDKIFRIHVWSERILLLACNRFDPFTIHSFAPIHPDLIDGFCLFHKIFPRLEFSYFCLMPMLFSIQNIKR